MTHLSNRNGRFMSIMTLNAEGTEMIGPDPVLATLNFRLRTVRQGPDGDLYITTDLVGGPSAANPGLFPRADLAPGSDFIIRVTPQP